MLVWELQRAGGTLEMDLWPPGPCCSAPISHGVWPGSDIQTGRGRVIDDLLMELEFTCGGKTAAAVLQSWEVTRTLENLQIISWKGGGVHPARLDPAVLAAGWGPL